ncbi:MAG: DnaD domain protein [Anaerolineae bacterium]|nr:DnaD domain protein [Anaerolineae bacterium]
MQKYDGFPSGVVRETALPNPFFSDLLPLIDDLGELKVVLFTLWALRQKEGTFRYLRRRDYSQDAALMRGLAVIDPQADPETLLDAALARAVERGALLCADVAQEEGDARLYFANTPKGQAAIRQIQAGQWQMLDGDNIEILPERPNIYQLYEDNIGPLTPLIADALKTAEVDYPAPWVAEAIQVAVEANARSWRYIEAVLQGWQKDGKHGELAGGSSPKNANPYLSGKYADIIEH